MNRIWEKINEKNLKKKTKTIEFITYMVIVNLVLGALIWLGVGRFIFPSVSWLICFMGYPAIFNGYLRSIFYLYSNEFT